MTAELQRRPSLFSFDDSHGLVGTAADHSQETLYWSDLTVINLGYAVIHLVFSASFFFFFFWMCGRVMRDVLYRTLFILQVFKPQTVTH